MTRYIAWIPARGGSKRLPRKNIMDFCGRPLIYHSIQIAQRCKQIEEVYVSTDDQEIRKLSKQYGAQVVERPKELSSDTATTGSGAKHLLQTIGIQSNKDLHGLITLQATQPLRSLELIERCITEFETGSSNTESLVTVSLNRHKIGKIVKGIYKPMNYHPEQRSQELEATYYENGVVYITKPSLILEKELVFDENAKAVLTEDILSRIDIDDLLDFEIAQFIYQYYHQHYQK